MNVGKTRCSFWLRRVAIVAICALPTALITLLLLLNHRSQEIVRKTAMDQLRTETERLATGLACFLSERADDLRDLAADRSIAAFFENQALGMSMDYGLRFSLEGVTRRLERFVADRQVESTRVYAWAAMVDERSTCLTSTGNPGFDDWSVWPGAPAASSDGAVVGVATSQGLTLTMSVPLFVKGTRVGHLRTGLNLDVMHRQFLTSRCDMARIVGLVDDQGRCYVSENSSDAEAAAAIPSLWTLLACGPPQQIEIPSQLGGETGMIGVRQTVPNSCLSVVNAVPSSVLLGGATPNRLLAGGILLTCLVLTGTVIVLRTTIRNTSLAARLEESDRHQRQIEDSNARLRDEVAERQRAEAELRIAKEAAEAANRAKSAFLANMSHEIRTPMTAILGFTDVLLGEDAEELSPGQKATAVSAVRSNSQHLLNIINDILDLSRIEAGRLTLDVGPCDLGDLLADVAASFRPQAEAKRIDFRTTCVGVVPQTVRTDALRCRQILINLLGNAIKFTERGRVEMAVAMSDRRDEHGACLQIDVRDTGIGIAPDRMHSLGKPFTQADESLTRKFGGTGLGLAISKRLAEWLGGSIEFESELGKGTRVRLILPIGSLEGVRLLSAPVVTHSVSQEAAMAADEDAPLDCRILLAEDSPDNQRLVSFLLAKAGARVDVVGDGQQAVEAALAAASCGSAYDVILMDMQMPVLDGYEATAALRRCGYHGKIIALTAHAMSSDRELCTTAGCDDYQTKPINRQRLIATVRSHLPSRTEATSVQVR